MGVFFPDIDLPTGCQVCRFAPIVYTPQEDGGLLKEQICLVKKELIQSCIVQDESEFPEEWWEEKHLECPGIPAEIKEDEQGGEKEADEEKEVPDTV